MRDKIMNTKLFKGLEPFKQKIYSNPKNIKEIEHLYGIAERISFVQKKNNIYFNYRMFLNDSDGNSNIKNAVLISND